MRQILTESHNTVNHDATLIAPEPAILAALLRLRDQALATRPASEHSRIERGYQIACAGGVRLDEYGIARVHSQRLEGVWYVLMGRYCPCNDHDRAPDGHCKHRYAACLWRRGCTQAAQRTTAPLDTLPAPYAFPQWTRYEAQYCGTAKPEFRGAFGVALAWEESGRRLFQFVPDGYANGWTVRYDEIVLGAGLAK